MPVKLEILPVRKSADPIADPRLSSCAPTIETRFEVKEQATDPFVYGAESPICVDFGHGAEPTLVLPEATHFNATEEELLSPNRRFFQQFRNMIEGLQTNLSNLGS